MSNIPEARELLELVLIDLAHAIRKLRKAQPLLHRPTPIRKAKRNSRHFTAEVAEEIRIYAAKHPTMPYNKIGARFKVNDGRVSEALRRLR